MTIVKEVLLTTQDSFHQLATVRNEKNLCFLLHLPLLVSYCDSYYSWWRAPFRHVCRVMSSSMLRLWIGSGIKWLCKFYSPTKQECNLINITEYVILNHKILILNLASVKYHEFFHFLPACFIFSGYYSTTKYFCVPRFLILCFVCVRHFSLC